MKHFPKKPPFIRWTIHLTLVNKYVALTDFSATKSKKTTAFWQVYFLAFKRKKMPSVGDENDSSAVVFQDGRRHGRRSWDLSFSSLL